MENPKRCGIYVRVSTQDQSTAMQKNEIIEFAKARGWFVTRIYEDRATGTTANRPMLKELLLDARARKIDIVICWKLDRFFRSLKDLINTLQDLTDLGIDFVSLRDQLDLTTSTGRLMLNIIGAFAQFESDICKERVRSGLRLAKLQGKKLGRPRLNLEQKIKSLKACGYSVADIMSQLRVGRSSVYRALK